MYTGYLDTITNRADWNTTIQIVDADTEEPVDLTGVDAYMQVVTCPSNNDCGPCDYGFSGCSAALSGSTEDGRISISSDGVLSWSFPASSLRGLCPQTYDIGVILKKDEQTTQLFLGKVTVLDGVVN